MRLVRGTHDLVGEEARAHCHVIDTARNIAKSAGFGEIITPILEFEDLFLHGLGETSDIVRKEMFVLESKGDDTPRIILRPEGTAPIMRTLFLEGLQQSLPQKFFYAAPMFRYDRPQKGRQRQFYQVGVELIGAVSPWSDVEVMVLALDFLKILKITGLTLEINTLGDRESRATYREALVNYFSGHKQNLSADSLERLEKNPLRILDSKDPGDRALVAEAPLLQDYLTPAAQSYFDVVLEGLQSLGIVPQVNQRLVRGLDYYMHTIFEITTTELGAQGTVLAGGRYDELARMMGKETLPAIGWAAGIERLRLLLKEDSLPRKKPSLAVFSHSTETDRDAFVLAQEVRMQGWTVDFISDGKIAQKFKKADRAGATIALILGSQEVQDQTVSIKHLQTGEQQTIARAMLHQTLQKLRGHEDKI